MLRLRPILLFLLALLAYLWFASSLLERGADRGGAAGEDPGSFEPLVVPDAGGSWEVEAPFAEAEGDAEGERSPAAPSSGDCTVRLVGATTPVSVLRFVLEPEVGQPIDLAIRTQRSLTGLAAGRQRLRCVEPGWIAAPLNLDSGCGVVDFGVAARGAWTGRVIDGASLAPIPSVHVRWQVRGELGDMGYQAELGHCDLALEGGRFSIGGGGFVASASQVRFEASGYQPHVTPWIDWDGLTPIELGDVELEPWDSLGAPLGGIVVAEEDGAPLSGVRVVAVAESTRLADLWTHQESLQGALPVEGAEGLSDGEGRFQLELRGPGRVRLAAFSAQRGLVLGDAVPRAPGATIRMPRRGVLRGRVTTSPAIHASGVLRGVSIQSQGRLHVVGLDDQLAFEWGGLAPGPVRVALQASEVQSNGLERVAEVVVRHVDLGEGADVQVELSYGLGTEGLELAGSVRLPEGILFEAMRAALWAEGDPSPSYFAVIAPDGTFLLRGAPARRVHLIAGGSSIDSSCAFLAMKTLDLSLAVPSLVELDASAPVVRGQAWKDGRPAARCLLSVSAPAGDPAWQRAVSEGLTVHADAGGAFAIHGLCAGAYSISRVGGAPRTFELLRRSTTVELDLE